MAVAFSVAKAEAAKLPSVFWHPCFIAVLRGWGIFQGLDTLSLPYWKEDYVQLTLILVRSFTLFLGRASADNNRQNGHSMIMGKMPLKGAKRSLICISAWWALFSPNSIFMQRWNFSKSKKNLSDSWITMTFMSALLLFNRVAFEGRWHFRWPSYQ